MNCLDISEGHGDGSTIRANASSKRVKTKEQYEKWLETLELDLQEINEELKMEEKEILPGLLKKNY